MQPTTTFAVGSLVQARGREWVVLPESQNHDDLLVLRPLVGGDDEVTGIYLPLEPVEPARFELPDPSHELGNHRSCALLRDAVRLGFRSAAGPFRSLGAIAVEPRPYQLVPLLMALRLDPVRLLIADDVGVGKSIETGLVLRELLDRGEIRSSTVLCPPHLAEQWHRLLHEQFHLDAALVLPGTAARLERQTVGTHESIFERFPHTVVSLDYIKSEKRRHELLRVRPDLVVVDEAHTCTAAEGVGRASQQRHALIRDLVDGNDSHLVLVTATPHSGKEETFRSLLALLDTALAELPSDLAGEENRPYREHLARHFVQRRRGDLQDYLGESTPFPQREAAEEHYTLTPAYRRFFDRVLAYCRERVTLPEDDQRRQRVRWWGALALLRALGSSPAAAAATLRNRAAAADTETVEEADDIGRRTVLDLDDEHAEGIDVVPGSRTEDDEDDGESERDDSSEARRLRRLARDVEKLRGKDDAKLAHAARLVAKLLDDGFSPIVFCRFIPTVDYVADALRKKLGKKTEVAAVTGLLPPEERERRVAELGASPRRVLVCTDCLSEGINLQDDFDAVMHYDLSWNPTRHEQREGRVDRFGQPRPTVRTLLFHGENNPVDGIVLNVLLRKHKAIRQRLGISVPVPMDTNAVVEAIFEGLVLREDHGSQQLSLAFIEDHKKEVAVQWEAAAERETKSRTVFSQQSIKVDEVRRELDAVHAALGDSAAAAAFFEEALAALGVAVKRESYGGREVVRLALDGGSSMVRHAILDGVAADTPLGKAGVRVVFEPPAPSGVEVLTRTHPMVSGVADLLWSAALDRDAAGPARRCGVVRTDAVDKRTTLLLLRLRYHIVTHTRGEDRPLLAEDALLVGFRGRPNQAEWMADDDVHRLLDAKPTANTPPEIARGQLERILGRFDALRPHLDAVAERHGEGLLDAHRRVRRVTREGTRSLRVEHLPPLDVIGVFVYLPAGGAG